MIIKFNKFERVAGMFILTAFMGAVVIGLSAAIKQGWFEPRVQFTTYFQNADGIHQGTVVQMAGLRAGSVESVELQSDNTIKVSFYILGKFHDRIRQDSQVQLLRPFVIGERVMEITVGSESRPQLASHSILYSVETMDLMSLMSGRHMNTYLSKVGDILESMQVLMEAFSDKSRAQSLVRVFDQMDPLVKNLSMMSKEVSTLSRQATQNEGVKNLVANLTETTKEMNKILPEMNRQNPELAKNIGIMVKDLAQVTQALTPAVVAIEPELPDAGRRLIEALSETVVVLKAMQKSFLMEGNVQEVKAEEAMKRMPAGSK